MAGKINMVITKSISCFARNTLYCLKYIRRLKDRNIPVLFYMQDAKRDGRRQGIKKMRDFLEKQVNEPLAYDE